MTFPVIKHIDDVLPSISGRKDFIHVVKNGYQVIDYVYEEGDSFDDPIRRECRGIKFDMNGKVIGRPLHKFHNYGQKLITYDWNKPHTIMTKLDGSMVHSCIIENDLRLCTRMGITEQSEMAEVYLTARQKIVLRILNLQGFNAIIEFTSPDNRIVIGYDEPKLTLLACRNIEDGRYYKLGWLEDEFEPIEIHTFTITDADVQRIRAETTGIEGYVVAWPDGTYVKIKGDEYCQMHRAVSYFERENMILPLVLDSQCDDIYPSLSPERASKLFEYEAAVMKEYIEMIDTVHRCIQYEFGPECERKTFALWVNANVPTGLRAAYFSALDGKNIKESVRNCILRNPDLLTTRWK